MIRNIVLIAQILANKQTNSSSCKHWTENTNAKTHKQKQQTSPLLETRFRQRCHHHQQG